MRILMRIKIRIRIRIKIHMLEDSYQGIALAIPQVPEISRPFRGWISKAISSS
jgi:hypothetical protein